MTAVDIPSGAPTAETLLGGRFRLDERISLDDQVSGLNLRKATDQLLSRPVTIYLLPRGPVPAAVTDAVRSAAKVSDPRLATIYDTDFDEECPYIVAEWARGTHLEDLVLSGLPHPALAAAMIADAADAIAVAHRAGRPHLRLTPRSMRWDNGSGLKITGLGLDAALCGPGLGGPGLGGPGLGGPGLGGPGVEDPVAADTAALARMLYALLTGYWPGDEPTALPPAPRHKGNVCTPRQIRAGVPAMLDAIAYRGLQGQAADAPLRPQTPAGMAMALGMLQRPSYQLERLESGPVVRSDGQRARHARARTGSRLRTTLLRPAV
jgi:hypothetical protein